MNIKWVYTPHTVVKLHVSFSIFDSFLPFNREEQIFNPSTDFWAVISEDGETSPNFIDLYKVSIISFLIQNEPTFFLHLQHCCPIDLPLTSYILLGTFTSLIFFLLKVLVLIFFTLLSVKWNHCHSPLLPFELLINLIFILKQWFFHSLFRTSGN